MGMMVSGLTNCSRCGNPLGMSEFGLCKKCLARESKQDTMKSAQTMQENINNFENKASVKEAEVLELKNLNIKINGKIIKYCGIWENKNTFNVVGKIVED